MQRTKCDDVKPEHRGRWVVPCRDVAVLAERCRDTETRAARHGSRSGLQSTHRHRDVNQKMAKEANTVLSHVKVRRNLLLAGWVDKRGDSKKSGQGRAV